MTAVFVIGKNGEQLMPTTRFGRVRHMLEDGLAVVHCRSPFTIRLTQETTTYTQPMEVCVDTGCLHIGVSVKSLSREYISAQYDLLSDEKERHDDKRKLRRTRRNHLRYREPRFNNRSKPDGWFAPSIQNKADRHIDIIKGILAVAPIQSVVLEMGQFDTQLLQALEERKPIPKGKDYQKGELTKYEEQTLRGAVFERDKHTCLFCGRNSFLDGAILHAHHVYFWRGQHGDRLSEMATACEECHTPANHQKGGKLYGYDKKLPRYTGAAFMNIVRWHIYHAIKDTGVKTHITYGAMTKIKRSELELEKSHVNDAYSMGELHPQKRAKAETFQKQRRNNRILEKFYDAKFNDVRDHTTKKGSELGCERINRREPRNSKKSLRRFRGHKISKGRRVIRRNRYDIRPGDIILFGKKKCVAVGVHNQGTRVILNNGEEKKSIPISKITVLHHISGWKQVFEIEKKSETDEKAKDKDTKKKKGKKKTKGKGKTKTKKGERRSNKGNKVSHSSAD